MFSEKDQLKHLNDGNIRPSRTISNLKPILLHDGLHSVISRFRSTYTLYVENYCRDGSVETKKVEVVSKTKCNDHYVKSEKKNLTFSVCFPMIPNDVKSHNIITSQWNHEPKTCRKTLGGPDFCFTLRKRCLAILERPTVKVFYRRWKT